MFRKIAVQGVLNNLVPRTVLSLLSGLKFGQLALWNVNPRFDLSLILQHAQN